MVNNKVYDVLKYIAQFVLPAVASLYFGLAKIWNLPYSEQVVGTILAFDAFLGAILGISLVNYNRKMANLNLYVQPTIPGVISSEEPKNYIVIPNNTYDILYWVANVVLPALGALYFALAPLWQLPYSEQIVGTLALVDAFLGIFLGINTAQYNKLNPK